MIPTSKTLLDHLRSLRDQISWARFIETYEPLLRSLACRRGIPPSDIPDVIQEVLVQMVKDFPNRSYHESKGKFRSWLTAVANNTYTDWLRRHRRRFGHLQEDSIQGTDVSPDEAFELRAERQVMSDAIDNARRLASMKAWLCFQEHRLNRRRAREVARELSLTENAVYLHANRVLKLVRNCCREYLESTR